uniref:Uncharacterized protein n=1 Tax=Panagrolaimus sp. PS1159 TaxID=55785 RepID=A0AC35GIY9_9BILA
TNQQQQGSQQQQQRFRVQQNNNQQQQPVQQQTATKKFRVQQQTVQEPSQQNISQQQSSNRWGKPASTSPVKQPIAATPQSQQTGFGKTPGIQSSGGPVPKPTPQKPGAQPESPAPLSAQTSKLQVTKQQTKTIEKAQETAKIPQPVQPVQQQQSKWGRQQLAAAATTPQQSEKQQPTPPQNQQQTSSRFGQKPTTAAAATQQSQSQAAATPNNTAGGGGTAPPSSWITAPQQKQTAAIYSSSTAARGGGSLSPTKGLSGSTFGRLNIEYPPLQKTSSGSSLSRLRMAEVESGQQHKPKVILDDTIWQAQYRVPQEEVKPYEPSKIQIPEYKEMIETKPTVIVPIPTETTRVKWEFPEEEEKPRETVPKVKAQDWVPQNEVEHVVTKTTYNPSKIGRAWPPPGYEEKEEEGLGQAARTKATEDGAWIQQEFPSEQRVGISPWSQKLSGSGVRERQW